MRFLNYEKHKDVINIILAFLLTAGVGNFITNAYQTRAYKQQVRTEALREERKLAMTILEEMSQIVSNRHYSALILVDRVEGLKRAHDKESLEAMELIAEQYRQAVYDWNVNWNLLRAKINRSFGLKTGKRFYSYESDSSGKWEDYSITGKFRKLHKELVRIKREAVGGSNAVDFEVAYDIYHSLGYDIYAFYDSIIHEIQDGNLGPFNSAEEQD